MQFMSNSLHAALLLLKHYQVGKCILGKIKVLRTVSLQGMVHLIKSK